MKKRFLLIILTLILLMVNFNSYSVVAQNKNLSEFIEWRPDELRIVPNDKMWLVEFNDDIDETSLTPLNVFVIDENGVNQDIALDMYSDNTIAISPPVGGYKSFTTYFLYLSENISREKDGKTLENGIMMRFHIEKNEDISIKTNNKISGGSGHTVSLKEDGTVWAWGDNWDGQLGDGTKFFKTIPVQVVDLENVVSVSAGGNHTVALKEDGTVWAWGSNSYGQLGEGTRSYNIITPVQVVDLENVISVSAGYSHTVALREDGTVWAWGDNANGKLGDGSDIDRTTPAQVVNLENVVSISAGNRYTIALKEDGTVWTWGYNGGARLGVGNFIGTHTTPKKVPGIENVVSVSAGDEHTVVLKDNGTVWEWGWDGTNIKYSPTQVVGLTKVVEIYEGFGHTVALKDDGTVWTWGYNSFGQLGDGSRSTRTTPVQVVGLENVISVSAGSSHTVALKEDGSVWTWGWNNFGQLGNDSNLDEYFPVKSLINLW